MVLISILIKLTKGVWAIIKYLLLKIIDKLISIGITLLLIYLVYLIINYYIF